MKQWIRLSSMGLFFLWATIIQANEPMREDTWLFAGQSNMHPGAQFQGFQSVIQKSIPDVKLRYITSQRSGKSIAYWNEDQPGWKLIDENLRKLTTPLRGMVWYQGESDMKAGHRYREALTNLISRVRKRVGNPNLPVIIVQLASARTASNKVTWGLLMVRESQRQVAEADEQVALVSAIDLPLKDQQVHIDEHEKLGNRQGLAALSLAYAQEKVTHGPQFERAWFLNSEQKIVVFKLKQIDDRLSVSRGWQQGFAVLKESHWKEGQWSLPESLPAFEKSWTSPIGISVVQPDHVLLRFEESLPGNAKLTWAMSPNATWGKHRRWHMNFQGVTDSTGIILSAFGPVNISKPGSTFKVKAEQLPTPTEVDESKQFEINKSFQIAVNAIARFPECALRPNEHAGIASHRQGYWNSVSRGLEPNLIDSNG